MARSLGILLALAVCIAGLWAAGFNPLEAHDDDPKLLDRQPPYIGEPYRSGGPNPTPLSVGFPSNGVELLSWLPLNQFGSPSTGNDCWGYTSPSGREYAIFGHSDGTAFVEITDPTNPVIISNQSGPNSLWRDIKTYSTFAYAVSEGGGGIQVFNLANIDNGQVTFVRTVGSSNTHNVAIDTTSGFLYRTGGVGNGLIMYSLSNPGNPVQVGTWSDRYVHDAQVVTYTSGPFAGRQIAFCAAGLNGGGTDTGVTVLDVTNKAAPFVRSQTGYSNRAYSHQLWIDEEAQYLYHGDELDEGGSVSTTTTRIFDISDLDNVTFVRSFTNGSPAVDHNMYILGDTMYQANYRSGLRVWDISNRTNPVEVAFFDTYPDNDSASFNGLWSCYPYFASGVVIGSDLERGLFVFNVGDPAIRLSLPSAAPENISPAGEAVTVRIEEVGGSLTPGTAKLNYRTGPGAFTEVDLAFSAGDLWDANFPATTCGDTIEWYVTAQGDDGIVRNLPATAPTELFSATSTEGFNVSFEDTMEGNLGWVAGQPGDDATTGIWTRGNPIGTAAQPEDDHTNPGTQCWFTGQGSNGGSVGENDVDNGQTTLLSPLFDLSGQPGAVISYWRWFSNNQGASPNTDIFAIDISDNGGSSWVRVETVGPTGSEAGGGWFFHQFTVADFVVPSSQVRMRFIASDEGDGSIVEAALDDFRISSLVCLDCNDNGIDDADDIGSGFSEDCNNNGIPDECDISEGSSNDANNNGIPDECESAIFTCGEGAINAGCGATSNNLFVNNSSGGSDRTIEIGQNDPITFSIREAPAMEGDSTDGRAIIYFWFTFPEVSDVVNLPKQLGPMCFGPKLVETRPADLIWNSIGLAAKAGAHNAPTPPPNIPDNTLFDFYSLPGGWGSQATITLQGFVPDDCTQGTKPFSVTNGIQVEVQ